MNPTRLLIPLLMLLGFVACSDDEPSDEFLFTEIATLDRVTDTGSDFTLYLPDGPDPVTMNLPYHLESSIVKPGQRVMLTFASPETDPFRSPSTLRLLSYRGVSTLTLDTTEATDPLEGAIPFNLQSAWLTGPWLNFKAMVPYLPGKVKVEVLTPANVAGSTRDIYLIMTVKEPVPTFERETFGSVSLAPLLDSADAPARIRIRVHCPSNPTVENITLPL